MKNQRNCIQISLGCDNQRLPGYIGLDQLRRAGTDVICDLNRPLPFVSACADHVYARSSMEHVDKLIQLMTEAHRFLRPGGTLYIYAPHWGNPFYYSDPTHRRFFGLATLDYFLSPQEQVYRRVPVYERLDFRVVGVRLIFLSPFRPISWLMRGLQWIVNYRVPLQVFYEYHVSSLIPCYAVEYRLHRE